MHLFVKHDKLEASLIFENLKLGDESIRAVEDANKQLINGEKIAKLIQDLGKDAYNFTYASLIARNDKKLNYASSYKLNNNKESIISTNLKGSFREEIFTLLDNLGMKFDTDQSAVNLTDSPQKLEEDSSNNLEEFLKQDTLKEFDFNFDLQANNAFSPYISTARASLEALQNQSSSEKQNLLYSQMLKLINDIGKDPLYKLNLTLGFKDIPVSGFIDLKEESIIKVIINGKGFNAILKTIS